MTSSYLRIQTDHCRRESCTSALRKNIKELPRDHFHTCIVVSACNPETPSPQTSKSDYWIGGGDRCKNDGKVIFDDGRQSRIVDEWATCQARGTISSIEKQAREAELLALSSLQPVSARACSFQREMSPVSPTLSDCSSELPNLRTSSLVQMWRELESEARIAKTKIGSMSSEVSCRTYLASNTDEEASGGSEVCNSVDERSDTEWESDCISPRAPPPPSVPNGGESETVRVAVMVKRLSLMDQARNSVTPPQDEIYQQRFSVGESYNRSISDQRGDIVFLSNRNYPRVRGHAATRDLLARMEMERRNDIARLSERRAVSQFSHRSRIQALLRFRFLRGVAPVYEQQRPASTAFELKQLKNNNTILELRERFNSTNQQASRTVPATDRPSGLRQFQNNVMDSEYSVLGEPSMNNNRHRLRVAERDNEITLKEQHSLSSISEELQEDASPSADVASQEKSLLYGSHSPKISGRNHEISSLVPNSFQYTAAENLQEEEANQSTFVQWQEINLSASNHECQGTMNTAESLTSQEGDMPMVESDSDSPQHIREPESDNPQPIGETDGNWFGSTSHPWRGWSGHREPIYTNWPESTFQNMEICELLERRPVSTALSSDFRARMEWVMSSYVQRQRTLSMATDGYGEEEDAQLPDHVQEDNEAINDNQLVSTSVQLPLPSQLFHQQEIQQPSLADEPSHYSLVVSEMEVVEKLRGEMERLHWEMSELRKSIDSCMNMRVELQNAIKNDISATAFHSSGASTERLQSSKQAQVTVKGICCICCEMQVDSLLYRCGHMCTCFKCAHELQWSTGRCPICRSPIVDVVRAFSSDQ